jgi:hypothetical protein
MAACLPRPDDPIEWVERPEAIIVQMREGGLLPGAPVPPSFTLYGDGTLIYDDPTTPERALTMATLSKDTIVELLEDIEATGFFNFSYDQPQPEITDSSTTYFYVNTKSGANAVSAYALNSDALGNDEDWSQFRKLQEIQDHLQGLDPDEEGGRVLGSFEPERHVLFIARTVDLGPDGGVPWPYGEIDLDSAAPEVGPWNIVPVAAEDASRLAAELGMEETQGFEQGDAVFEVALRPVLPYEENFPEFDAE